MIFHLNFEAEKQKLRSGREDIGGGSRKRTTEKCTKSGKSIRLTVNCTAQRLVRNLAHNQDDEAVGGILLDLLAEEDVDGDDDGEGDDDVGAFLVVVLSVLVAE